MTKHQTWAKLRNSFAFWGAAIGAVVPLFYFGPELIRRLIHVAKGGQVETALWGEPLFYIFIVAIPLSAIGYATGRLLGRKG